VSTAKLKLFKFEILVGIILIAVSALLSLLHWLFFKDVRTLFFYIMEDIVFLPIQVLLVTLVLDGFLSHREQQAILEKLNMLIELFFSEIGVAMIKNLAGFDAHWEEFRVNFTRLDHWKDRDFEHYRRQVLDVRLEVNCQTVDLASLNQFLLDKRDSLLRLLENPNLLEHETFSDLMWVVFHLTEEFVHLKGCSELSPADRPHLIADIERAYFLLIYEWLGYMRYLKNQYPYLFSLALRNNPFV
jgi:hypothetical protein